MIFVLQIDSVIIIKTLLSLYEILKDNSIVSFFLYKQYIIIFCTFTQPNLFPIKSMCIIVPIMNEQINVSRVYYHTLFEEHLLLSLDAAIVALYSCKLPVNKLSKYMALKTTCTHTMCIDYH